MSGPRERLSAFVRDLQWAWTSHKEVPYLPGEIWTRRGREAHYRRWTEKRVAEVRSALSALGVRAPEAWSSAELLCLRNVLVDRCYEADGFGPIAGSTVVDAGCGSGDFTLLAALSGPGTHVVSFDPDPSNVRRTHELLAVNNVEDRAEVHALALGDRDGTVRLGSTAHWMLSAKSDQEAHDVPVRRLDSLVTTGRVDLLKVDVEGMEAALLAGAQELLTRDRPRIIVGVHGKVPADETADFLEGKGYSRTLAKPKRRNWQFGFTRNEFWSPTRPTGDPGSR